MARDQSMFPWPLQAFFIRRSLGSCSHSPKWLTMDHGFGKTMLWQSIWRIWLLRRAFRGSSHWYHCRFGSTLWCLGGTSVFPVWIGEAKPSNGVHQTLFSRCWGLPSNGRSFCGYWIYQQVAPSIVLWMLGELATRQYLGCGAQCFGIYKRWWHLPSNNPLSVYIVLQHIT